MADRSERVLSVLTLITPAVALLAASFGGAGCTKPEGSNLEKVAHTRKEVEETDRAEVEPGLQESSKASSADPSGQASGADNPALNAGALSVVRPTPTLEGTARMGSTGEGEKVELRFALAEGTTYVTTTIGGLRLPMVTKVQMFAREEQMVLSDCRGEGEARACTLTHGYRNYDAEPPTGAGLIAEEGVVSELATTHQIDATGKRLSETKVDGPKAAMAGRHGQALARANRFYCLRLPSEPVGVGATWTDVCEMRQGGALITRELVWKLEKLEDGKDGKRATLRYAGKQWADGRKELPQREGGVQGSLLFWVEAGEPHLMREQFFYVLNKDTGLKSSTDIRIQFTKLGEDGETKLRTDGVKFDQKPVALNDPDAPPLFKKPAEPSEPSGPS